MSIEEQFFKTFGIEKISKGCDEYYYMPEEISCKECDDKPCLEHLEYPKITAEILLKLICIENDWYDGHYESASTEDLKEEVLEDLIHFCKSLGEKANEDFISQVRALFGGEE